ncbi:MAG: hypothetical protein AMXMBFR47_44700 [Planctomycetota bacterium]
MTCPFTIDQLSAWVQAEEEDASVAAQIESHVAVCAACRSHVEEMRAVLGGLRSIAERPPESIPSSIGPYRITGKLGEGGMGIVYAAEQAEPRRKVALKVIRGAHAADDVQRRLFARELQSLARLNHPNIAGIYDAGRTPFGEPYFAMEFVEGVDLFTFCARPRALALRERVTLMLQIARAMSHAHERGIIHRDLKPANILVRAGAHPVILDFGLARVLDADAADARTTRAGAMLGTLAYMSPEQARGDIDAVDIRSDVYSLGVILYETLTGHLPVDVAGQAIVRAVQMIQSHPPHDPRALNRALPRDLAIIAMKCLEKQPERRYGSAADLAQDLERFLTGHAILARPASRTYRAQRFVRRNAVPVLLVTLLFAAITAGGVSALVQAGRIAAERDRVLAEATKVARLNSVLENLWQSVDPWKAGDRDVRVLDVFHDIAGRVELEMKDTPLLAAAVRTTLGNAWRSLGSLEDFTESERHLRFAFETRRSILGAMDLETVRSANDLAETLYWKGEFDEARSLLSDAIAVRARLLPADHPDLAESLNNLGSVLKQLGDLPAAEHHYRRALAVREQVFAAALAQPAASQRERAAAAEDLAETRNNLAALHRATAARARDAGDAATAAAVLQQALAEYRRALDLRRVWLGDAHPSTATTQNNLGRALQDAGRYADAEQHLREALRILRAGVGERHQLVARALHNLARLKRDMGDRESAKVLARDALAMRTDLLGPNHRETGESDELLRQLSN